MTPIFNASALYGLSTSDLEKLRLRLFSALAANAPTDADRRNLYAALDIVETILRSRAAAPPPAPRPGF